MEIEISFKIEERSIRGWQQKISSFIGDDYDDDFVEIVLQKYKYRQLPNFFWITFGYQIIIQYQ